MESRQIYLSRYFVKRGYSVTLFTSTANHQLNSSPTQLDDTIDEIKVKWIVTRSYQKAYGLGRILSWFHFEFQLFNYFRKQKELNPDIVIVSSLSLLSILNGIYLKRKCESKLVFEIRDIWPLILTEISSISKWNPLYFVLSLVEKWGYHNADVIVGTMPNLGEHVRQRSSSTAPVLQIPHLLNDNIAFKNTHTYVEQLTLISQGKFPHILAYSGSISKSAGLNFLLDASEDLRGLGVSIVLLGQGPLKNHFQNTYKRSNVHFFDKIPQSEVVAFLKDCDILYDGYLHSDIYKFGTSRNKYVEYCLAEKPLLVSYSGYKLFIEEHNCGIVVLPESTSEIVLGVKKVLAMSPSDIKYFGQNALSYAKSSLNPEAYIDTLLACINSNKK